MGFHVQFVLAAQVEILHASPVNTTGVPTPDLVGCVQDDMVHGGGCRGARLRAEIVDEHDVDERLVEEADQQSAAVRGDGEGGCAVVRLLVIDGPR